MVNPWDRHGIPVEQAIAEIRAKRAARARAAR
jgi:hypothetical protein